MPTLSQNYRETPDTMMPTAKSLVDPSLKSRRSLSSSDIVISKDAAPSAGNVSNGPSLGRSILEAYGKEILEFASDPFLDLAMGLRLKTINERDLVSLLAKAERLGYSETDIIDDEETVHPVQEAHEGSRSLLDALGAPKPPGKRIGQVRSFSTASPQHSTVEESRESKRLKTIQVHERGSVSANGTPNTPGVHTTRPRPTPLEKQDTCSIESIQGRVGMREQKHVSARAAGKPGQKPGTIVGTSLHVGAPVPQSSNVLEGRRIQSGVHKKIRHRRLIPSSVAKQSLGTSAKHIDLVVISDSEPESNEDANN